MISKLVVIGFGGVIGAIGRYALSGLIHRLIQTTFPLGTLIVNLVGCFGIGVIMYLVQTHGAFSPNVRLFLTIGILGAFTTFSTFGYETIELLSDREFAYALANIAGNVLLGLVAVWLGRVVIRMVGW